ncbi:MAG TPA: SDR family NAD(P)-dependent oxidoreductase [Noviherbaspirillum sp.]|jgi:NAD(P)-dependent dehydrogenase (short-subunit alcohol dehydrogenase family)|uniref:SDR family NAD(P)-dependent oxidoreductase n=1 Tax=Noviherbaspirillum sp. TaxID=1926288 RepID=UPI002F94D7B9
MSTSLQGKSIIVTGGFGALGRALGAELSSLGARVALLDRSGAAPDTPAGILAIGGIDLGDPTAAHGAFAQVASRFGGVDGLVNVAGAFIWEKLEGGTIEAWDRMYAINLRTAVVASQTALSFLLGRGAGRIVNIGALASVKAAAGMGAYAASKAGVARLTESLAEELKDTGITVNAVLPSIIDTPANRADMPDADASRWVTPEALSKVIAFLLSDAAAPISGACIPVAGRV